MENGVWSMGNGTWSMKHGAWRSPLCEIGHGVPLSLNILHNLVFMWGIGQDRAVECSAGQCSAVKCSTVQGSAGH